MTTRAVTPAASAAATSIDTALETGFLPDDPYYRLHGKFKADEAEGQGGEKEETETEDATSTDEEETTAVTEDASAAANAKETSETAAASEAASTQERKPTAKTAATSETRWQKLSRENRELRDRLTKVESGAAKPPATRENKQASQPAADGKATARPEPQIDDVDTKTGLPKYPKYADYNKDLRAWDREQAVRDFQETSSRSAKETANATAKETIAREFSKRVESARTKYADYDDVALNPDLPIREGSPVDVFTLDSDHGTDVLYHLGANPAELDRIQKLNPVAQIRELTKIELKYSKKPATSAAKPVTQAPRPPHQTSGSGVVGKDPIEEATETGDFETYRSEQNARDLARRKRK